MRFLDKKYLKDKFSSPVHIAPLAMFRVIFGAVMFGSVLRFISKGWVEELYVKPGFYFQYYGFEWVKPLGAEGMYFLFGIMALSFLFVALGLFYRVSISMAFLTFTYAELIDKANYLNHYYFVSVVCFLLILLPAHRYFSLDVLRNSKLKISLVPRWTIDAIKFQLALVYIFAGVAKLNYDWLFRAMPLKIWLPANTDLPLIGTFFDYDWVAYFFSWFGAAYDLFIIFFLLNRKTRLAAYGFVIVFHVMTKILFPIGMFPYIMIFCTLIFFSEDFHKNMINKVQSLFNPGKPASSEAEAGSYQSISSKAILSVLTIFFCIQLLLPWRFLLYPGKLFWTEQGYRFSWRVMLMEKAGTAFFYVKDKTSGQELEVMNCDFLTKNQEKMMATQPDMILQFAHYLKEEYKKKGIKDPEVRVESYVTLNGSGSRLFLDKAVDLTKHEESFLPKPWILAFEEK